MNILLIGHEGYVGSGLYKYFSSSHNVIGWGRKDDIMKINKEMLLSKRIDVIVNCATIVERNEQSLAIESLTYKVNILAIQELVRQLNGTQIKLIYISTKDVYGELFNRDNIVEEKHLYLLPFLAENGHPFHPITAYGKSKLIGEYLTECHDDYAIIRFATCYTDYAHYRGHWIPNIIQSVLSEDSITLTNKGKQVRDLLHVNDLGELITKVIKAGKGKVKMNCGGGVENTLSIVQLLQLLNSNSPISYLEGEDYGFAVSNDNCWKHFKWQPKIKIQDRLPFMISNLQNNISATEVDG